MGMRGDSGPVGPVGKPGHPVSQLISFVFSNKFNKLVVDVYNHWFYIVFL